MALRGLMQPGLWPRGLRALAVLSLLALGLTVQLHFFTTFPQPPIFGDPRGYYETGQRFLDALSRVRGGEPVSTAFESVRGLFFLVGVGSFFAALEWLRPGDLGFFRLIMAGFNTLAMLGSFMLGRSLSRSFGGGLAALALAACYPSFALQTGRLYPDPITGCFFVWAAWLFLEGARAQRAACLIGAGLSLSAALLIRSQLAAYMLLVLGAAFAVSAPLWLHGRKTRNLALAFALSLVPIGVSWLGIGWAVGDRDDVIQFGNLTFRPTYPLGFWVFLDTDGWSSAYPFKADPFYKEMVAENLREPGLFRSSARQAGFVLRYVARRPLDSLTTVLNNAYRLYDRPANDYKWDYPFSYDWQVGLQRALCVFALAGLALFASESVAALGAFLVPLALLALHGLMFTWPRYNVPTMPIVIAAAGACLARLASSRATLLVLRGGSFAAAALVAAGGLGLGAALTDAHPEAARALRLVGTLGALWLPFLAVGRLGDAPRTARAAGLVWAGLAILVLARTARDREWHARPLALGGELGGVDQEISLSADAVAKLRGAREAFLVLDLAVPRGEVSGLGLTVAGRRYPGAALVPTMPRLAESTSTGGRDARGYPQWWALRLDPAALPDGPFALRVSVSAGRGSRVRLGADRFAGQQRSYEGPSFGERPNLVPLKLEYDGDYRLAVAYALESDATRTTLVLASGERRPFAGVARIRLVTLANDAGSTSWRAAPAPARARRAAWGFFAYSGVRDDAELLLGGRPLLRLPLDRSEDYVVEAAPYSLCHRALGLRGDKPYGAFVLVGPAEPGRAPELDLRFVTGMNERPMFFVVDARRELAELATVFDRCRVEPGVPRLRGAAEVLDASRNQYPSDTGRWTVAAVF